MRTQEKLPQQELSAKQVRTRFILSFSLFLFLLFAGWKTFVWIRNGTKVHGTPKLLRASLNANEKIFSGLFDTAHLVKEYPSSAAAKKVRVNGNLGLRDSINANTWRLQVVRITGDTLKLTLDEIKALPKKDIVFDFKCIEGWSQITHWAGVPLKTFLDHYGLKAEEGLRYVGLQTPDKKYYVGIDMPSALHPQTLLCYEMNGAPLPLNQGYPLRLIIPVKYGIKHLKRIGTIFFGQEKPADYWAERGYDYYSGH